ncbi:MAG: hypothetical protein M3469_01285 [Actinomycetota bacterium]|nr:hypothetical protein [Solirubrobacterales bacterium]MDQ3371598.1 hypothetical protein [Actinomycetota bacterium]MDQ3408604.1 hypothetical protein [Actinomycetota bacterium]
MARVVALMPDLLFGSNVQGALAAAGHEVQLVGGEEAAHAALPGADVLVLDLAADADGGLAALDALRAADALEGVRVLAAYAHVEAETKVRAEAAGVDLAVPRSRMAREGAALVERLLA